MSQSRYIRPKNALVETSRGIQPITVEDKLLSERMIFFTDQCDEASCNDLLKQLMYLEKEDDTREITLYINSPGGLVSSGLAVYDYIRLMHAPVRTVCIGCAASMAGILFLAGDEREMYPHTTIMLHDPSFGGGSLAGVKPRELSEMLESISDVRESIAKIISERVGLELEEVYKITEKDSYFSAERALSIGIATRIIDGH